VHIGEPARKHGVKDADILHAFRNSIRQLENNGNVTIFIGTARNGALLEIGILEMPGEDPAIIHAMPLRKRYYRYL
jgi:hypothetical protein